MRKHRGRNTDEHTSAATALAQAGPVETAWATDRSARAVMKAPQTDDQQQQ